MSKNINFLPEAWEDYLYLYENDRKLFNKVNRLIKEIQRTPFIGIGKPEPLRHEFAGYWSREIDKKHRIIYCVNDDEIEITQCRTHYGDK